MTHRRLVDAATAVADHVHAGDTVFLGGFGHCVPYGLAREVVRQGITGLTVVKTGADVVLDEMVAGGVVDAVVAGYVGNPGVGLAHAYTRARAAGDLEVEEWTNFTIALRLEAARLGLPFLPTRVLRDGDLPRALGDRLGTVRCPFTGEDLTAVPALEPDVALVHAQRATVDGAVQLWGVVGDTLTGARAARRIVVSVEEVVSADEVREWPDRTVLSGPRVVAVCHLPGGARPSYVHGVHGRDDAAFADHDRVSRDPDRLAEHLAQQLAGPPVTR